MAGRLTRRAALDANNALDHVAELIVTSAPSCGISSEVAQKFAAQCDMLADHIARHAGVDLVKLAEARKQGLSGDDVFDEGKTGFDAEEIGEEKAGPLQKEKDEPYMTSQFTQQENRELREKTEDGEGKTKPSPEEQKPTPGVQASLSDSYLSVEAAASSLAKAGSAHASTLSVKVASVGRELLEAQYRVLTGSARMERIPVVNERVAQLLPLLKAEVTASNIDTLGKMSDILTGLAKGV